MPINHIQTTGFTAAQIENLAATLNSLLADVFTLYLKTKNFHWHMSGPHFRDYHLLLDENAGQLFSISDEIAERVRKIGAPTLRSIGHIARLQRIKDSEAEGLASTAMLGELLADEQVLLGHLRAAHTLCDEAADIATASLIENWIGDSERRHWFLNQTLNS